MSSEVDVKLIQKLRQQTGARMLDCKQALEKAEGNFDQAIELVEQAGLDRAESKEGRETSAGLIVSYVHNNGKVGSLVEVQCETDFVAKNKEFKTMARDIAMQVTAMKPENVADLLQQKFIKDASIDVETLIKSVSGKIGENMKVKRFVRYELGQAEQELKAE